MKKLMTALTICAVAGFAVAADVVSENVVGFYQLTKFDANNAWAGQAFQSVGGTDRTLATMFNAADLAYGDSVQLFDGVQFVVYSWNGTGWEDGDLNVVGVNIPDISMGPSAGMYLTSVGAVKLTGEVKSTSTTVNLPAGYTLACCPYPTPFNVDNCDWSAFSYGDAIQVWDTPNLQFKVYSWNGTGWEDGDLNAVTGEIAAIGESVFFQVAAATSFSINSPL